MRQDILKDFWMSALFFPMPLESSLRPVLAAAGMDDEAASKLLGNSFLTKRIQSNPSYYVADKRGSEAGACASERVIAEEAAAATAAAAATK